MTSPLSGTKFSGGGGDFPEGISVIICAHNAADRIGETLRHLAKQQTGAVQWEIILVDNGSTDNTTEVARRVWPIDAPAPLRLLSESTLGYNRAADHGIAHARFSIIAHVHDDNWLAEDWLARVAAIFRSNPEIGACGGLITGAFDCAAPKWFSEFQENYAVGPQGEHEGDITWSRGYLWGAGLCLRRTAWMEIKRRGFQSLGSGRTAGKRMISGEDTELCYALRLAGWKLWYSENLCLTHYIPAARLNWRYLRALFRSFGESSARHDCYLYPLSHTSISFSIWRTALLQSLRGVLGWLRRKWTALFRRSEGNPDLLRLEWYIGRTIELIRLRDVYADAHRAVLNAKWRKVGPISAALAGDRR
jgi:glycosyltransferase involved in cell wall biosynthesis